MMIITIIIIIIDTTIAIICILLIMIYLDGKELLLEASGQMGCLVFAKTSQWSRSRFPSRR